MRNLWLLLGAISGFVGVSTGAFGAHALKARLSPDLLAVFETGSRYQLVHALALCLVGFALLGNGLHALLVGAAFGLGHRMGVFAAPGLR